MCPDQTCARCASATTVIPKAVNLFCVPHHKSANHFKLETIAVISFVWTTLWVTTTATKHLILVYDLWLLALQVSNFSEWKFIFRSVRVSPFFICNFFPFSHSDSLVVVFHSKSISTTKNPDESKSPG